MSINIFQTIYSRLKLNILIIYIFFTNAPYSSLYILRSAIEFQSCMIYQATYTICVVKCRYSRYSGMALQTLRWFQSMFSICANIPRWEAHIFIYPQINNIPSFVVSLGCCCRYNIAALRLDLGFNSIYFSS